MTQRGPIPVIDLFAGPGGLGEGFTSLVDGNGQRRFSIKVAIEKDPVAHKTLSLRAFFRQFEPGAVPECYYEYVRGKITRQELFAHPPDRLQVLQPLRVFLTHRALLWKAVGVLRSGAQGKGVVNGSITVERALRLPTLGWAAVAVNAVALIWKLARMNILTIRAGRSNLIPVLWRPDDVLQHANAIDFHAHAITGLEPGRGLTHHRDARRRAGRDAVTRFERHVAGDVFDQRRNVPNQFRSRRILPEIVVDPATQPAVGGIGHRVTSNHPRTDRAKAIHGFGEAGHRVALVELEIARRQIVHDGVAADVIERAITRYCTRALADDDPELDLIVELGHTVVKDHVGAVANDRIRKLEEQLGDTGRGKLHLVCVRPIIPPDADDFPGVGNGRHLRDRFKKQAIRVRHTGHRIPECRKVEPSVNRHEQIDDAFDRWIAQHLRGVYHAVFDHEPGAYSTVVLVSADFHSAPCHQDT